MIDEGVAAKLTIERVNELHQPVWIKGRLVCSHCMKNQAKHQPWPCATAKITRPAKEWGGFERGERVRLVTGTKDSWLVCTVHSDGTITLTDRMEDGKAVGRMRRHVHESRLRRI